MPKPKNNFTQIWISCCAICFQKINQNFLEISLLVIETQMAKMIKMAKMVHQLHLLHQIQQTQVPHPMKRIKDGTGIKPGTNGIGGNGTNPILITLICNLNLDLLDLFAMMI